VLRWACLYVCLSARSLSKTTIHTHEIFCTCYLWPWLDTSDLLWRQCNASCTSGFVDDVMCAYNRPDKGGASRAYILSDSPGAEPGRSLMSTIGLLRLHDVTLLLSYFAVNVWRNCASSRQRKNVVWCLMHLQRQWIVRGNVQSPPTTCLSISSMDVNTVKSSYAIQTPLRDNYNRVAVCVSPTDSTTLPACTDVWKTEAFLYSQTDKL